MYVLGSLQDSGKGDCRLFVHRLCDMMSKRFISQPHCDIDAVTVTVIVIVIVTVVYNKENKQLHHGVTNKRLTCSKNFTLIQVSESNLRLVLRLV